MDSHPRRQTGEGIEEDVQELPPQHTVPHAWQYQYLDSEIGGIAPKSEVGGRGNNAAMEHEYAE